MLSFFLLSIYSPPPLSLSIYIYIYVYIYIYNILCKSHRNGIYLHGTLETKYSCCDIRK